MRGLCKGLSDHMTVDFRNPTMVGSILGFDTFFCAYKKRVQNRVCYVKTIGCVNNV